MRFQIGTSKENEGIANNTRGGRRYLPYVFTEQGIAMLAGVYKFHDRFILLDNNEMYHLGASIKDLGKKCFAISKVENKEIIELIKRVI